MGKEAILRAVVKLIATRGPEQTSVRNVAAEAGVSIGAVQHYYKTKDDLLLAAMRSLNEYFSVKMEAVLGEIPDPKAKLRVFLHELAAIRPQAREGAVIWTVFAARACVHEGLRDEHSANWDWTENVIFELLCAAFPNVDVTRDDAAYLLALSDGIAVSMAAEHNKRMNQQRAQQLIDTALTHIAQRT